jgi:peptidoglycan glycosyltransferase
MTDNIRRLAGTMAVLFFVVSLGVGYWQIVAGSELSQDPRNPRLYATALSQPRGQILDRDGVVLAKSEERGETFRRVYAGPLYEPWLGYATLRFGSAGIEAAYARSLIGQDPSDPLAALRRRYLNESEPPGSVVLAISTGLQQAAERALGNRRGAVIALEPRTGEILASVSVPRYDPNPLADPQEQQAAFERLQNDQTRPLLDRAAQGLYIPGSIFKLVTGAAALELGAIQPEQRVRVDSPWQGDPSWGRYAVRSPTNAHRSFNFNEAYAFSENIYFAMAGVRVGGERLADYANRFLVGRDLELDAPFARTQLSGGGKLDRPTLVADTSFGQGELLVSPLQMALITSVFANGGMVPTPHYGLEVRDGSGSVIRRVQPGPLGQAIRPDTARRITDALVFAVETPGAFAYGARIPGVRVAGKTGTAEREGRQPHGWFVGFAPADNPTIAVAVVIEDTPRGGEDAAPIGGAVMREWLRLRR